MSPLRLPASNEVTNLKRRNMVIRWAIILEGNDIQRQIEQMAERYVQRIGYSDTSSAHIAKWAYCQALLENIDILDDKIN